MDNLIINLTDVSSNTTMEPLEKGWYDASCTEVELTSSQAGAAMVKWTFTLKDSDGKKRKLFNNNVLDKDFGRSMFKKTLESLGFDTNDPQFNVNEFIERGECLGLPIKLSLGIQVYNGEKRNNIKDVAKSGDLDW